MSHIATKWAFDQPEEHRDMKPSEWAVLMVLADCHNPVNGCFPSQDYICSKTNLSDRAVRDQLGKLKERKLVAWEAAREDGRRGSNRYRLAFEGDFQPANPAGSQPEESAGSATGKIEHEQPANSDQSNRQNLPTNPVREPVITEPRLEREARARPEPEPDPDADQEFQSLLAKVAKAAGPQPVSLCYPPWSRLDAEARKAALSGWEACLAAWSAAGRRHPYGLQVYLRDRMWEQAPAPAGDEAPKIMLALRSGEWFSHFWGRFLAGNLDVCRKMIAFGKMDVGWRCDAADAPAHDAIQVMPKIDVRGEAWSAWRKYLDGLGLRFDQAMLPAWVWVPSEWPQDDEKTARTG